MLRFQTINGECNVQCSFYDYHNDNDDDDNNDYDNYDPVYYDAFRL